MKGPWFIKDVINETELGDLPGIEIVDQNGVTPNSRSDYQLMAAAPELLKELRMLLLITKCPCARTEDYSQELYWERRCARCAMAKGAIAKAEGRE